MCDGQAADDCDFMNLAEFETTLKNRLTKLDDQFATLNEILNLKKEALIKLYRKNPRNSHDETFLRLQAFIEAFDPTNQAVVCDRFSDDNENVIVSSCKRSVKFYKNKNGYCFLNHPKIEKNQILKWSLQVPKFKYSVIGMVIILE